MSAPAGATGRRPWWPTSGRSAPCANDLDEAKAVDILFLLAGHDTYRNLVLDAGWPPATYRAWLFQTLRKQFLASQRRDPKATVGLSFTD